MEPVKLSLAYCYRLFTNKSIFSATKSLHMHSKEKKKQNSTKKNKIKTKQKNKNKSISNNMVCLITVLYYFNDVTFITI